MIPKIDEFCISFFNGKVDGIEWFSGTGIMRQPEMDGCALYINAMRDTHDQVFGFEAIVKKEGTVLAQKAFKFDDYFSYIEDENEPVFLVKKYVWPNLYKWSKTKPTPEDVEFLVEHILEYINKAVFE
jgi:hypothetical protein